MRVVGGTSGAGSMTGGDTHGLVWDRHPQNNGANFECTFGLLLEQQGYGWNIGTSNGNYEDGMGYCSFVAPGVWRTLAEVSLPAETSLLSDVTPGRFDYVVYRDSDPRRELPAVHNGGGNYAFVDGHGKWFAAAAVVDKRPQFTVAED